MGEPPTFIGVKVVAWVAVVVGCYGIIESMVASRVEGFPAEMPLAHDTGSVAFLPKGFRDGFFFQGERSKEAPAP